MATYIGNKFGKDDHDKLVSACLVMAQMSSSAIPIYLDVNDFIASNQTSSSSLLCRLSMNGRRIQMIEGNKLSLKRCGPT